MMNLILSPGAKVKGLDTMTIIQGNVFMVTRTPIMMIRWLLLLCCLPALTCLAQTPVVSAVSVDVPSVDSSSLRLFFDSSALPVNYRVRWNTTDCSSGTGGTLQASGTVGGFFLRYGITASVSGLPPGQTLYFCPEVTTDNINWSSGVSVSYTMPSTVGPVPPALPAIVPTAFPVQTGTTRNVLPDCSNLQTQMYAASYGDTIAIPAGTVCTTPIYLPNAPEAKIFPPSAVNTTTSTITLPGHGFVNGQQVHFSTGPANANCLPGDSIWIYGFNCDLSGGLMKGKTYYVVSAAANTFRVSLTSGGPPVAFGYINRVKATPAGSSITITADWTAPQGYVVPTYFPIQFATTGTLPGGLSPNTDYYPLTGCSSGSQVCSFQVSTTNGGSPVTITSAGTGTLSIVDHGQGNIYVMAWPPANNWIVVTTTGNVPPNGVRTSAGWQPQMATIENTTYYDAFAYMLNSGIMSHNWRFVGIEWTSAKNNDYLTTIDPRPYGNFMRLLEDSGNIIFDRNYIHGWGYPQRLGAVAGFVDGFNVGFINSELSHMDYWHPWFTGFAPANTSSTVTLGPGQAHYGSPSTRANTPTTTGNTVISLTGGVATGTGYVYFDMNGTMQVLLPAGMTATCSTSGVTCVDSTAAVPAIPTGAGGGVAGEGIVQIVLAGGAVSSVPVMSGFVSAYASEGCQCFISGGGPGPYILDNNLISGTGIPYHFDDGGGPFAIRGDYFVHRNTWTAPLDEIASQPGSNNLRYGHRQFIEWKGGQRILFDGNIMSNAFQEQTPTAPFVAMTPRNGGWVTDITITNNIFQGGVLGIEGCLAIDAYLPASRPCQRQRVANNIFANLNAYLFSVVGAGSASAPNGVGPGKTIYSGWASSDIVFDHNSVLPPTPLGYTPEVVHWIQSPSRFFQFTNNIIWDHQAQNGNVDGWFVNDGASPVSNCPTTANLAFVNCAFPGANIAGNVIIPGYTKPVYPNPSGLWPASSICTAYGGTWSGGRCTGGIATNIVDAGAVAANQTTVNWSLNQSQTYGSLPYGSLSPASPYTHLATDGTDPGVSLVTLLQHAGIIAVTSINRITTSGATVTLDVPDPGASCRIAYGTGTTPYTWSLTSADTSPSTTRNIGITGLAPHTRISGQVWCAGAPPVSLPPFSTL
jgi:hypothetical protein